VRLWDVATGKNAATLKGHTNRVSGVAFSPNGKTLVSVGDDNMIRLWNVDKALRRDADEANDASPLSAFFDSVDPSSLDPNP
jgi:WD40 repeat protein